MSTTRRIAAGLTIAAVALTPAAALAKNGADDVPGADDHGAQRAEDHGVQRPDDHGARRADDAKRADDRPHAGHHRGRHRARHDG